MTREELEKRAADRRDAAAKARQEQISKDMEAIDALEASGPLLIKVTARGHEPGVAVQCAFRMPTTLEYRRYSDTSTSAYQGKNSPNMRKAQELLADACFMYPAEGPERAAMIDAFPGLRASAALALVTAVEGQAEDEGKG